MFKRVYPVVLGVYTVLLASRATCVLCEQVECHTSLGLGKWMIVFTHNAGATVMPILKSLF